MTWWRIACVLLIVAVTGQPVSAAQRRAVVIGIDEYVPRGTAPSGARGGLSNLRAAVADAKEMEALLRSNLFGFDEVTLLCNGAATREAILSTIRKQLIERARPGDVSLLYFAGHGSQMRNSRDPRGFDETIVPADAWKGVFDIRDKEIARLLNDILSQGAIAVAIFDSCHSGDISRGLPAAVPAVRRVRFDPRDAAALPAIDPGPAPESRGALILTSALDKQSAIETVDELGRPHGVFTLALIRMLRTHPDSSAADLMRGVRAFVHAQATAQEPVLRATPQRERLTLLGASPASGRALRVAVRRNRTASELFQVDGGSAIGFRKGIGLRQVTAGGDGVRLVVQSVDGPATSTAATARGRAAEVRDGDLFEVETWIANPTALRLWWPSSSADLSARIAELDRLLGDRFRSIDDPTETLPDYVARLRGDAWELRRTATGAVTPLSEVDGRPTLFIELPPTRELERALAGADGGEFATLQRASDPSTAHYVLSGRRRGGRLEYAWIIPNRTRTELAKAALPPRSKWVALADPASITAGELRERAVAASRIHTWRNLESPPGAKPFPYRLAFRPVAEPGTLIREGALVEGTWYRPVLIADVAQPRVVPRYVYIFTIDSLGEGTLLYPTPEGTQGQNYVPPHDPSDPLRAAPPEIRLDCEFEVGAPLGNDSYILFTSATPIAHAQEVFNWTAVLAPSARDAAPPVERMLGTVGAKGQRPVPATWSIEHLALASVARPRVNGK